MATSSTPHVSEHIHDLSLLASSTKDAGGLVAATDVVNSIENLCRNMLDDELAGATSLLFDRSQGLPTIMLSSLENARRNEKSLQSLRMELLRLIDYLIHDHGASQERAGEGHGVRARAGARLKSEALRVRL